LLLPRSARAHSISARTSRQGSPNSPAASPIHPSASASTCAFPACPVGLSRQQKASIADTHTMMHA
jgi:hypothetical protein